MKTENKDEYQNFLKNKKKTLKESGFEIEETADVVPIIVEEGIQWKLGSIPRPNDVVTTTLDSIINFASGLINWIQSLFNPL